MLSVKTKGNWGMEWCGPTKRKEETDWKKKNKILGRKNAKY